MFTIKIGNKTYRADIKEDNDKKAFQSVYVYFENEKMPIYGTRFSSMTSHKLVIMPWIFKKCEEHAGGKVDSFAIFGINQTI